MIPLLLAAALAAEPAPVVAPDATASVEPDDATAGGKPMEIVVYGRVLVEAARNDLIETASRQGYSTEIRRDGYSILRHDDPWKGDILLHDDGRVEVHRQPVRFEPPFAKKTPLSWLTCIMLPLCLRPNGQLVSPRKFHGAEQRALAAIEPEVMVYNDRIADWASDRKSDQTGARLEDLWMEGTAVDGGPPISDYADRRAAILAYWDTRTDNEWGDRIRARIEAFVRGEVQQGEHPFSAAEIDAFNARRRTTRVFPDVTRPRPELDGP